MEQGKVSVPWQDKILTPPVSTRWNEIKVSMHVYNLKAK